MTEFIFNICNGAILIAWGLILFLPRVNFSKKIILYPWIPLGISFFYSYFIFISGGISDLDPSSLNGIVNLFKSATPESAAAGWLHYLAFDFWVATWIIRHSQIKEIKHFVIILPLIFTFILGPIGILIYSIIYFINSYFIKTRLF